MEEQNDGGKKAEEGREGGRSTLSWQEHVRRALLHLGWRFVHTVERAVPSDIWEYCVPRSSDRKYKFLPLTEC